MELQEIVNRFAEGLVAVDASTKTINQNRRTKALYLPGVPALNERQFMIELAGWWINRYSTDFLSPQKDLALEIPYPNGFRENCDLVANFIGHSDQTKNEWAIEVKYCRLVGDNGKNNDYGVAKVLSPYLKDRSLTHDVLRLTQSKFALKKAVILYGFEYNFDSCNYALSKHPNEKARIKEIGKVCRSVDPSTGDYSIEPMAEMIDYFLKGEKLIVGQRALSRFSGAWRHPTGGNGAIYGWQVN